MHLTVTINFVSILNQSLVENYLKAAASAAELQNSKNLI